LCWNRRTIISTIKDLTGQRFGKLLLIERLPNYKNGKTYYRCVCDCGKEVIIYSYDITSGKRNKCKTCSEEERVNKRRIDRTGQRFGRLVIIEMLYDYNNTGKTYVKCSCDCGNVKIITMSNLTNGHAVSCGCWEKESRFQRQHFIDIVGERFGMLTVVKKTNHKYSNGSILWECLCDCGRTTIANYTNLKDGQVQSCGCKHNSKWENMIGDYLKELNITFCAQKRFKDCTNFKGTNMLPFDFYIQDKNLIIEYDGEHHFKPIDYWGGEEKFKLTQQNDRIKDEYCKLNKITLLRLPYTLSEKEIKEKIFNILNP
jgi:very-short-patch-repair endonuclease